MIPHFGWAGQAVIKKDGGIGLGQGEKKRGDPLG